MKLHHSRTHTHEIHFFLLMTLFLIIPAEAGRCSSKNWLRIGLDMPTSVYSLAVDPSKSDTIYAGTHNGGVFKSTDGGKHFHQTSLSTGYVSALLIDPTNPKVVYAGCYGALLKSIDGGENWENVMSGQVTSVVMATNASGQQTIYAATRDKGILKSTDQGHLWKKLGFSDLQVTALALDPKAPDTVYAGIYNGGIYRSVNGGSDWTLVGLAVSWISALQVDPVDSLTIYAGTINGNDGLFKSADGGNSWQQVTQGSVWAIAVSPASIFTPSAVYIGGTEGVLKSTDTGNTWKATDLNYAFLWVYCLAIDRLHSGTVFAGTEAEGAFKTIDGGSSWNTVNNGINDTIIQSLTVDPSEPRTIYAGADGVFKTTNKGRSWVNMGLNNTVTEALVIDPVVPQTVYAATMSGVYKSVDGGGSWKVMNTGLGSYPLWVNTLAINPVDTKVLYAATTTGLYKSTNAGATWKPSGLESINIRALAIDPTSPSTIYAGSYAEGMFKSTNAAVDWATVNGALVSPQILSIVIDPQNPKTIYIGTDNRGLFKSTNGGTDWNLLNAGLSGSLLTMDPSDPQILYAFSVTRNLYKSTDAGASWNSLPSDLPFNSVLCLAIDPTARQTPYIGTGGAGVWAYALDIDINLGNGGTAKAGTGAGADSTMTGIAEISIHSGSAPYAASVITLKQNGATISETVVPSPQPTTRTKVFIDSRSKVFSMPGRSDSGTIDVETGIAIVNYEARAANLVYTLRDISGTTLAIGHGTVVGRGFAKFLDQLPEAAPDFLLPPDFSSARQFGSLEISSDSPVGILAMRLTTNQRQEVVLTTAATTDLASSPEKRFIPQIADGGGYTTSIALLNTSTTVQKGVLRFFNDSGAPLSVNQAGGSTDSAFTYSIPAGGAYRFQTDGSSTNVKVGWVELDPELSSVPDGTGIISFSQENILVTETAIALISGTNHARMHIDLSGRHNTGLAIANPSSSGLSVAVNAFERDGVTPAGISGLVLSLPEKGHTSKFASELVQGLPAGFIGVLDISSTGNFAVLTARSLYNERNETLMSSMPVADYNSPAPVPVIIPRVVEGGGYSTDFVLISAGSAADTTLSIYGDDGITLDSGIE